MERFRNVIDHIGLIGTIVGACVMAGIMFLIVTNVIVRFFGPTIIGAYQLVELAIVVTVSLALPYTALNKAHTSVKVIVSNLSKRKQALCEVITSFLGIITWGAIAWASASLMIERGLTERTDLLEIPYLPSKLVWVFGLTLSCVVLLSDLIIALRRMVKK
ncbi:MAG: TRAP transporter small permease [Deltaproteobacteria bacterium]|nr:TRAP transporter small permease [Deltaproteobacteria bacterium]